jgi:hypothetical protein
MSKGSTDFLLGDKTSDNTNPFSLTQTSTFTTPVTTSSTTDATVIGAGSIITSGGISVAKQIRVAGTTTSSSTTDSSSTSTGSIQTLGGIGIAKSLTTGGKIIYTGKTTFTSATDITIPVDSILTSEGASMTVRVFLKSGTEPFTLSVSDDVAASLTNRLSSVFDKLSATVVNTSETDSLSGAATLNNRQQNLVINITSTAGYIVVDISGQLFLYTAASVSHFHWTAHKTTLANLVLTSSVASSLTGYWVIERITK